MKKTDVPSIRQNKIIYGDRNQQLEAKGCVQALFGHVWKRTLIAVTKKQPCAFFLFIL